MGKKADTSDMYVASKTHTIGCIMMCFEVVVKDLRKLTLE